MKKRNAAGRKCFRGEKGSLRLLRAAAGSFTVEAALLLTVIFLLLGGLWLSSVKVMQKVRREAEAWAAEETAVLPSDLIRFSLLIREWIPEKE